MERKIMPSSSATTNPWPAIPYAAWRPTCTTLHRWIQIVGKLRVELAPWVNHSWHATFYVTARGLTTSTIPCGTQALQIDFDFVEHVLRIATSDGQLRTLPLVAQPVADFYAEFLAALAKLGISVRIHGAPNELSDALPFSQDREHRHYDPDAVQRFWRALVQVERVFQHFRTGYLGKVSPVHLFWGSFDLAVTRFSGRSAPPHPGGIPNLPDAVTREAYSHEVSSAGFWPGGSGVDEPAFYSYAYPAPDGFASAKVEPAAAYYHDQLGEFLLPYEAVRTADRPDAVLLQFLESTYAAAADAGNWDRARLECPLGVPGTPRKLD